MLDSRAWRTYEPRFAFPIFRGVRGFISFSLNPEFRPLQPFKIPRLVAGTMKRGLMSLQTLRELSVEYCTLPFSPALRQRTAFRMIVTTRQGRPLGLHRVPGTYPPGGSIDVDVSGVTDSLGLPDDDYLGIMVMSRGRQDFMRSSPGSYSMTYIGERTYTTYRTGGFSRILNEPNRKGHRGFRGINPKAVANERFLSSVLLINHSSNPQYDETVRPTSVLLTADGQTREADFGPIAPLGAVEKSLEDLFGRDVSDFLAPWGGKGTVITTCPGVTLASIHLMRARDGGSMSIEHSRPTHAYLVNGAAIG